jgi:hypothetical protein
VNAATLRWMLMLSLAALLVAGCDGVGGSGSGSCDNARTTVSHGGPACDYVSFVDQLRAAGATVNPIGNIDRSFFAVGGYTLTADAESVQVYEYPTHDAMERDAALVSADGYTIGTTKVSWIAPPHFYRAGRIIVIYPGADSVTLERLNTILGPAFAGK